MEPPAFVGPEPGTAPATGRPLDVVLARLEQLGPVRRSGHNYRARCPAHDDHSPSLDVAEGDDGRVLVQCRSRGCTAAAIAGALGLEVRDLFGEARRGRREPVVVYPYLDETGEPLFEVLRFDVDERGFPAKDFRQRRVLPGGGREWGLGDTRRVLYRLPEVCTAIAQGATVYVVEGEKDADAIARAGACATCNPMGAGKWRDHYAEQLDGAARVVVVADRDEPGLEHAQRVVASLERRGIPVELRQAAVGKDAADHLAAGRTLEQLEPVGVPEAAPNEVGKPEVPPQEALSIVTAAAFLADDDDVPPPLVGTPDETLLPAGGLLIMAGEGGAGKTTLTLDAVAHLASGTPWLEWAVPEPVRILILENEGPRAKFRAKLREKADAWQGSPWLERVHVLRAPWGRFTFAEPEHRAAIAAYVAEHDVQLVVADPLGSLGVAGVGAPDETRAFMALLRECGLGSTVAFWLLHHFSKGPARSVVAQLSGDWGGHADTVLGVEMEPGKRTKLTYAKLRWATPRENPVSILEWLDGRSFKAIEAAEIVGDDELLERILDYLKAHPEGVSTRDVERHVKGKRARLVAVLKRAAETGEDVVNRGTDTRPKWAIPFVEIDGPGTPEVRQMPHSEADRDDEPADLFANASPGAGTHEDASGMDWR